MGRWLNLGCHAFTTDPRTVTWRRQILGPWRDWQEMGLPSWMVGQYVPSINENDRSTKTHSQAVMCHEWFLDCNVTTADSRAVTCPAKDGIAMLSGSMSGCMIVAWSLKDVFRRPWWVVWPHFWAWALWLTRSGDTALLQLKCKWKRTWYCVHSQKE